MALIEHLERDDWQEFLRTTFEHVLHVLKKDRFRLVGSSADDLRSWHHPCALGALVRCFYLAIFIASLRLCVQASSESLHWTLAEAMHLKDDECLEVPMAEGKLQDQLPEGIRMKGGIAASPGGTGFVAIVHTWDNPSGLGEPKEWMSAKVFPTERAAMRYYKKSVRPALKKAMRGAQKAKGMKVLRRELE